MATPHEFRRRRIGPRGLDKAPAPPRNDDVAQGWSGGIRALYDGVAQEPLPPEFVALLAELANKSVK